MITLRELARALGGKAVGGQVLCPGPGHSPRDRSLSVRLSATAPDGFVVHSFAGDDIAVCRDHVRERVGMDRRPRRPKPVVASRPIRPLESNAAETRRAAFVREQIATLGRELVPVHGTPGELYFRDVRRINTDAITDVIQRTNAISWHPSVLFRERGHDLDGKRLGAIIAVMTDPATAEPTGGISRTYVHDCRKVAKAKGLGPCGVVRLSEDADAIGGLYLSEGLETSLAAMSIGLRPLWSCGSTSIMRTFPVLTGVEALTIIADHDANGAGEHAAKICADRWRASGREVRVFRPGQIGDFNDVLQANIQ